MQLDPAAAPHPVYTRPAAPVPYGNQSGPGWGGPPEQRRSGVGRAFRVLLVTLLVLATPLIAGYISYQVTTRAPLWPISITY